MRVCRSLVGSRTHRISLVGRSNTQLPDRLYCDEFKFPFRLKSTPTILVIVASLHSSIILVASSPSTATT